MMQKLPLTISIVLISASQAVAWAHPSLFWLSAILGVAGGWMIGRMDEAP